MSAELHHAVQLSPGLITSLAHSTRMPLEWSEVCQTPLNGVSRSITRSSTP
jgi:hypothetical protein